MAFSTITNKKESEDYFNIHIPDSTRFAMANTASRVAFLGIEKSNEQFRREFNLSNKYLIGSATGRGVLKFNRAIPHHNLNKIESSWGAPPKRGDTDLDFLEEQETGFRHKGMVPGGNAYPGKNTNKGIKRSLRRIHIELKNSTGFPGATSNQRAIIFLRQSYQNRYGMPGSKQFIYLRNNEYRTFREGMYQFVSSTPKGQFPNLRLIYAKEDKVGKSRKATKWMQKSSLDFSQKEIDIIYGQEFQKAFIRDVKKNWRP